jgi:hypothetical protein
MQNTNRVNRSRIPRVMEFEEKSAIASPVLLKWIVATPNVNALCACSAPIGEVDVARNHETKFGCAIAVVADFCSRADRVHHAGGQHARRSGPRVSAGHLAAARNTGQRDRLHQRLALVRRRRRRMEGLGLLPASFGPHSQQGASDHVFGRAILGCALSRATVVFESVELEQLGIARVPAAASTAAQAPPAAAFAAPAT